MHHRSHAVAVAVGFVLCAAAGARAQSDADAKLTPATPANGSAGAALEKALKGIHADGPLKLTEAVQADLIALLPSARRGEECPSPATASPDGVAINNRGDGALLVAQITSCQGSFLMIYSPGVVQRASRLLDLEEGQTLFDAHALNLRGTRREDDLAIAIHAGLTHDELHFFLRREGFAYVDGGVLKEFGQRGDCSAGGDVTGGFVSYIKVGQGGRVSVLRVDTACSGGFWQAKCEQWGVDGGLSQAGICALPAKLDAKSLHAAGWK